MSVPPPHMLQKFKYTWAWEVKEYLEKYVDDYPVVVHCETINLSHAEKLVSMM